MVATAIEQPTVISKKYIESVEKKSAITAALLDNQTEKYLAKLEKQEARIKSKLAKIDSIAAKNIFTDAEKQYQNIETKLQSKANNILQGGGHYIPWLDSAGTSLKFIENNPMLSNIKGGAAQVKNALGKVKELQNELQQAADVKEFIRQRKEYLKAQLQNYNMGSELKKYNQTAYYYSQQVNEYRLALNDPDKAERKVIELLNKLPAFQDFMQKNSILASLFGASAAQADPTSNAVNLPGLQTRSSVQQMIQGQIGAGGSNTQAMFQQNMNEAQGMMSNLKSKLSELGHSGGSDLDMPAYKPNTQKTKSFFKRIEYSANMQSAKSNYYFPTTTDIGVSAGYKLNDKSIIGIGASYKIGWGKDIQHIHASSQGMSLRSFIDIKLRGSFYASGGFEYNYQPVDSTSFHPLQGWDSWTKSGLIGISKIVSLKAKYFKKTKLQLLWDVFSYSQIPRTQALKFRVGYSF